MTKTKTVQIKVMVWPDGRVESCAGGAPLSWISAHITEGAECYEIEATIALPKPVSFAARILGKVALDWTGKSG
jgi:hypothetical protein